MPTGTVIHDQLFLPEQNTPIQLEVKAGPDGQQPVTRVYLNDILLGVHSDAKVTVALGDSQDLGWAELVVACSIQDLSQETDETSIEVNVNGVLNPHHMQMSQTVQQPGDIIDYRIKITLIG